MHSFKIASPEYPTKIFFDRFGKQTENEYSPLIISTPSLINNNGETFITIDGELNVKINYRWFDIYGRQLIQNELLVESGFQRINILSPQSSGFYLFLMEVNGVPILKKVCIMN